MSRTLDGKMRGKTCSAHRNKPLDDGVEFEKVGIRNASFAPDSRIAQSLQQLEAGIFIVALRDAKGTFVKSFLSRMTLAVAAIAVPLFAHADFSVSVDIAPPPLPVYVQPPIPGDGYMWTPGYWAWSDDDDDYYWVPGTWVLAPYVGALWTPGYWGWYDGAYAWHRGYWGTHIGYYGGINYGFGYVGVGYEGGHWDRGGFAYNRSVNNISNVHVTNVYNTTVVNNTSVNRVSYNGGNGGVRLQPTRAELSFANMPHSNPTPQQLQHEQSARGNPELRASINHGVPRIAATPEPGRFNSANIVAARPLQQQQQPLQQRSVNQPAATPYAQRPQPMPSPNVAPQPRYQVSPPPQAVARPWQQEQQRPMNPPQPGYAQRPQAQPQQYTAPRPFQQAAPAPQPMMRQAPPQPQMREQGRVEQPHQQSAPRPSQHDDHHER